MTVSLWLIAALFVVAGIAHFLIPAQYAKIVPPWLPAPMALVLISGVFEILGGVGVTLPVTRVAAGWGLIALLVAVFPANIQMLIDAHRAGSSLAWQAGLIARLPLQPAMAYWIYRSAIRVG